MAYAPVPPKTDPGDVRPATMADIAWLKWLQDRPFARDAGYLHHQALEWRIARDHAFVITRNNAPAGYVIACNRADRKCHITQVIIDEECWRLGLGARLMQLVELRAHAAAMRSITVRCATDALAHEFWPAAGLRWIVTQAGQRRWLACWSKPVGPDGRLVMPPPSRKAMRIPTATMPEPTATMPETHSNATRDTATTPGGPECSSTKATISVSSSSTRSARHAAT